MSQKTLLIVDDDPAIRLMLRRAMEREGYAVREATDGPHCLAEFARLQPNMVLLDVMMPGMDGFETCMQLRRLPGGQQIPILMITALNDDRSIGRAFEVGATDYVTKPVLWSLLRQRVSHFLRAQETEQALRQREEALAHEHNILQLLMDNLPDYLYVKDHESRFLMANSALQRLMGVASMQEMVGKNDFDFYPAEVARPFYQDEQNLLCSGQALINREEQVRSADGVWSWILTNKVPLRDENSQITGLVGIGHDITELRQAQQLLRESEERFRFMAETTGDALYRLNYQTMTYDYISPAIEKLTGYSPQEINALGFKHLVVQMELVGAYKTTGELTEERQQGKTGEFQADYEIRTKSGALKWLGDHSYPWTDESGQRIGSVGILQDISERKKAEITIRRQNNYLAALHETALALMNRLDMSALLQTIVARAGRLLGTDHGYIFLADPQQGDLEQKVGTGVFANAIGERKSLGEGVVGIVAQSGQPLLVGDYPDWPLRSKRYPITQLRSVVGVPLKSGFEVIGVLGLAYVDEACCFDEDAITLLRSFAQMAALALDNARLYTAVQQELAERKRTEAELARARDQALKPRV